MKTILLLFLSGSIMLFASTCKPAEDEESDCGIDSPRSYPVNEYLDAYVVQGMVQSATDDRQFLWRHEVSNVCPSTSVKGNYYIHVRKDLDSGMVVKISRIAITPGGTKYSFPTVSKTQYTVNSGTYYLYQASFAEDICGGCAAGKPFSYELRVSVDVKPGFGDAANYIDNAIDKLVIDSEYTKFKQ